MFMIPELSIPICRNEKKDHMLKPDSRNLLNKFVILA